MIKSALIRRCFSPLSALALMALSAAPAPAQTLLQVQYGDGATKIQPGFTLISAFGATILEDSLGNSINVDLQANFGGGFYHSENVPNTSDYDCHVYSGNAFADGWGTVLTLTLSGEGILPNTAYEFRGFNYYSDGVNRVDYTPQAGTGGDSSSVTYNGTVPPGEFVQYNTLMTLTSNSSGQIVLELRANTYTGLRFSGFELAAVPEPSAALLGGVGVTALLLKRRRAGRA